MLKMIARFESVAQAVKGVISIVQGARKAWEAYTAAAVAASVASKFTFAGAGGAVASGLAGGAAAGGAAGLTGAYLGGQFGVYSATAAGLTTAALDIGIAPMSVPLIAGGFAGFGAMQGAHRLFGVGEGDGFVNQGFGTAQRFESIPYLLGSTWNARSSEQASRARVDQMIAERSYRNNAAQQNAQFRMMQFQQGQSDFQIDLQGAQFSAGYVDPTRTPNWRDGFQRAFRTNAATSTSLLDRLNSPELQNDERDNLQVQNQKLEERRRIEGELVGLARERLNIMQQEAEQANQMLAAQRGNLTQMKGSDAAKLAQAIRDADSGQQLTEKQIAMMRRNNIQGYEQQIQSSEMAIINRDPNRSFIFQNQRDKIGVDQINADVKVASEMVLKLQAEMDTKAPEWINQSMKFLNDHAEKLKQAAKETIEIQFRIQREQQNNANFAQQNGNNLPLGNGVK